MLNLRKTENWIQVYVPDIKRRWMSTAVVLGRLCNACNHYWEEFFFQISRIQEETWLDENTIKRSLKKLKDDWIVTIEKRWLPAKNYYTINDKLSQIDTDSEIKLNPQESPKRDDKNNNKEIIINNNNNKPAKKIFISCKDDIREIFDKQERQKILNELNCLWIMIELWHQIEKDRDKIMSEIQKLREKVFLFWYWDDWDRVLIQFHKRKDWRSEWDKKIKKYRASINQFLDFSKNKYENTRNSSNMNQKSSW